MKSNKEMQIKGFKAIKFMRAKDKEIFFNALMNPKKPNKKLKNAMAKYKKTFDI
jgi:uncharacterized protein (DUF1778 family)